MFKIKGKWRTVAWILVGLFWVFVICYGFGYRYVPPTKDDIPRLRKKLVSNSDNERELAAIDLGKIGPDAVPAVPDLIKALRDVNRGVRGSSAWALGQIGTSAREAIPALEVSLDDPDKIVRGSAALALGRIGSGAGVLDALVKALDDKDWYVRSHAIDGLEFLGVEAAEALPKLRKIASDSDENPNVRSDALNAIKKIEEALSNE